MNRDYTRIVNGDTLAGFLALAMMFAAGVVAVVMHRISL